MKTKIKYCSTDKTCEFPIYSNHKIHLDWAANYFDRAQKETDSFNTRLYYLNVAAEQMQLAADCLIKTGEFMKGDSRLKSLEIEPGLTQGEALKFYAAQFVRAINNNLPWEPYKEEFLKAEASYIQNVNLFYPALERAEGYLKNGTENRASRKIKN